jgi:hypothetical protein
LTILRVAEASYELATANYEVAITNYQLAEADYQGGKLKLKLAEEMLCESRRHWLSPMYVLFDAWYAGESLLNLFPKIDLKLLSDCKTIWRENELNI